MTKEKIKYFVDVLMFISFLLVGLTGIFKMPQIRWEVIPRAQMAMIHDWSGIVLVILVLIHLILNFNWIVAMTKGFFKKEEN